MPARGQSKKKNTTQGVFFLLRPRRKAREGAAPLGAGTGPEQKKNTTQGVFFFAPAPGKGRGRRSPVGRRHGARAVFFFSKKHRSGPVPAPNGASPSPAFPRGRSKKNNTLGGVFFFALAPCRRPTGLLLPLPFAGAAAKKNTLGGVFFFALAPARHGASPSPAFPRGRSEKKTPWVVFFFFALAPPKGRGAQRSATKKKKHFAHPGPTAKNFLETNDAGHEQKGPQQKKTPWPLYSMLSKPPDPVEIAETLGQESFLVLRIVTADPEQNLMKP